MTSHLTTDAWYDWHQPFSMKSLSRLVFCVCVTNHHNAFYVMKVDVSKKLNMKENGQ